jgi:hypothetical protein
MMTENTKMKVRAWRLGLVGTGSRRRKRGREGGQGMLA